MKRTILWADDEIDLLRPHVLFLNERGYDVTTATSGEEALDEARRNRFDVVFLDEMMPGLRGLETLMALKEIDPKVPVVMITKSEKEDLIDEAIRMRIDDYLVKPVSPVQILSACRRLLDRQKIEQQQVSSDYVSEFNQILGGAEPPRSWMDWVRVHTRLSEWDLELARYPETGLRETHEEFRRAANREFGRYIEGTYPSWVHGEEPPPLSVDVVGKWVKPHLREGKRVLFVVMDCMRLDQWLELEPLLEPYFRIQRDYYYSILPTATPYSRNAIFSGLFPADIHRLFPQYWQETKEEERSKNRYERELLEKQVEALGLKLSAPPKYVKVYNTEEGSNVRRQAGSFGSLPFVALVYNTLDLLAHGRSESELLHELAPDEAAFRSITKSWFAHSSLFDMLKVVGGTDCVVVITTDHGAIIGRRATRVLGDRETSTNLRYKYGTNLGCDGKHAMYVKKPETMRLPADSLVKNYILAKEDYYFVYPTNYHEYERQYRDTFQHGGISLEEMILPVATLTAK
jgi:CheY-like chemotaxis protein